jgi:PhzF family phenazine biosynthesis protein
VLRWLTAKPDAHVKRRMKKEVCVQKLAFKQVDVFTRIPFLGNPVAVVLGAEGLDSKEMQRIAAWTNLSETTFVLPPSGPNVTYRLRIFTPRGELPFAGHPTIGSAHAVIEHGLVSDTASSLVQECGAGLLRLTIERQGTERMIFVDAPLAKLQDVDAVSLDAIPRALGARPREETIPQIVDVGPKWLIVDLGTSDIVQNLKPNLEQITHLSESMRIVGITVFGRTGDSKEILKVRSFGPIAGVFEDPVCGSGNASVAAYLDHWGIRFSGKLDYIASQGREIGRDGYVSVRVNLQSHEVSIGGHAVTCVTGELRV